MEINGTIKNARFGDRFGPMTNIRGQVFDDTKGRFISGEWIQTSPIIEIIVKTQFSTYRVEFAKEGK